MEKITYFGKDFRQFYDFGNESAMLRTRARLSQQALAELVGVSNKTIRNWEQGFACPRPQHLKKLLEIYVKRGVFTPGLERAEALELWNKAEVNAAFDSAWIETLLEGWKGLPGEPPDLPASSEPEEIAFAPRSARPLNPLIGRQTEIDNTLALLAREDTRLITITGPGGVGKTRLAHEILFKAKALFGEGGVFVPLETAHKPEQVLPAIAQTLGLMETGQQDFSRLLEVYLWDKKFLLVLDNFEQVVEAAPEIVHLLESVSGLKVIVTSRAVLKVNGEFEVRLEGLALPDFGKTKSETDLMKYSALTLAFERIRMARPDLKPGPGELEVIAKICGRLDGLPLAIELAAPRLKIFTPRALLAQLENGLKYLSSGLRDLPLKQRSLEATLDWSYQLLEEKEKRLFRRLAIFRGPWTFETAAQICNPGKEPPWLILEGLEQLADKSLIKSDYATGRFFMLQTIREYALEKLLEAGEFEDTRIAHLEFYLSIAEKTNPSVMAPFKDDWYRGIEEELANLEEALSFALQIKRPGAAMAICLYLEQYWLRYGRLSEGRQWVMETLALSDTLPPLLRARGLNAATYLAWAQGDYEFAAKAGQGALEIFRRYEDREGVAGTLLLLGLVAIELNRDNTVRFLGESLACFEELGNDFGKASALTNLARMEMSRGNYDRANALMERSLTLYEKLNDRRGKAVVLKTQGSIAFLSGKSAEAIELTLACLEIFRQIEDKPLISSTLFDLALAYGQLLEFHRCYPLLIESLDLCREVGNQRTVVDCLNGLAGLAAVYGQAISAAKLAGAAQALAQKIKYTFPAAYLPLYSLTVSNIKSQLEPEIFEQNWQAGLEMDFTRAYQEASSLQKLVSF